MSPDPEGVAKVPSPRKKVVVLFGGVGTIPHTVLVIVAGNGNVEISAFLFTPHCTIEI